MLRSSHWAIKLSKRRAEKMLKIITESGARVRFVSKAQKSYEVYQLSFVLKTIQKFNIEKKAKITNDLRILQQLKEVHSEFCHGYNNYPTQVQEKAVNCSTMQKAWNQKGPYLFCLILERLFCISNIVNFNANCLLCFFHVTKNPHQFSSQYALIL